MLGFRWNANYFDKLLKANKAYVYNHQIVEMNYLEFDSVMTETFLVFQMNYDMEEYMDKLLNDKRYDWDYMNAALPSLCNQGGHRLLHCNGK